MYFVENVKTVSVYDLLILRLFLSTKKALVRLDVIGLALLCSKKSS